jgi:hypothetical protein
VQIAPFQFQSVGTILAENALLPSLEGESGAAGEMAALNSQIVDAL